MLIDAAISGDRNMIKKEAEKILKYKVFIIGQSDTSNNRGDWNHFKITRTVPQQHTRKA